MRSRPGRGGAQAASRWSPWPRSLAFRVVALSTIWAILALVLIATVISTLFRQASERGFEDVLSAHLFSLIGSVGVSDEGVLSGTPNLGDLRFSEPLSGWYWAVEPESEGLGGAVLSQSMVEPVPSASTDRVPFNDEFQRSYRATGPGGDELTVLESELVLDDSDQIARFRVTGNRSELESEIASFSRRLFGYLSLFGIGMIAINVVAILLGLRPLRRVRQALADIRAGTAERLDGDFPAEIEPLAHETNALIESNRRIVERSRTQVGNLAHSLKTPLAVLMNEGRTLGGAKGRLIGDQAAGMQKQIDHYLQRARVAAQRDNLAFRTPVGATLTRMARVVEKMNPGPRIEVLLPPDDIAFAGEREDLEEVVGNLLENAVKWRRATVRLSASPASGDAGDTALFEIAIEDDGPGIPEARAREALERGKRLDESKPGTGLGLAIVADLVEEYEGSLALGRSELGGLKAVVVLQRA